MRILVIEDDRSLLMAVEYRLRKEQMEVVTCGDGLTGFETLEKERFDLVLLDWMLPGMDGVTLLEKLRAMPDDTPVLMLTAMDGVRDRVTGLDTGADDYLVKPFAMDEMMARIRALARRQGLWNAQDVAQAGDLLLDIERRTLRCRDRSVSLSRREGRLMAFFLRNRGQVLPRSVLIDRVWSDAFVEDGNLDIYVHFLRKRLKELNSRAIIRTVRGVGYQLTEE